MIREITLIIFKANHNLLTLEVKLECEQKLVPIAQAIYIYIYIIYLKTLSKIKLMKQSLGTKKFNHLRNPQVF